MIYGLFNTAHPLAESGKPIFIPFGEWPYDKTTRQRLDREHGEAIANELNERVARGEPGIPVYQGHPDVPDLAAKYPDKGALGWVTKIALANENGRDGLALTVEWDRDPGKGFKWFSPYWFANENDRDGQTYIVASIRSIGLVNNPNIPEFRLANEAHFEERKPMNPYQLPQHIIDLANEYDESKHPRAEDGKWTSGGGGGGAGASGGAKDQLQKPPKGTRPIKTEEIIKRGGLFGPSNRGAALDEINSTLRAGRAGATNKKTASDWMYGSVSERQKKWSEKRKEAHKAAVLNGFQYNRATKQYEDHSWKK